MAAKAFLITPSSPRELSDVRAACRDGGGQDWAVAQTGAREFVAVTWQDGFQEGAWRARVQQALDADVRREPLEPA